MKDSGMNKLEMIKYLDNERNKYQEAYDKLQPQDIMRVPLGMRLRDLKSALAKVKGEKITLNDRNNYYESLEYILEGKSKIKGTSTIKVVGNKYYIKGGGNES